MSITFKRQIIIFLFLLSAVFLLLIKYYIGTLSFIGETTSVFI